MNPDVISGIYASEIVSGFDIYKPEKMNQLFSRYGDQGASYFQLIRSMGFEQSVAADTYGHFEENRIHQSIRIAATVSGTALGDPITLAVHADSLDAAGTTYLRKYDQVMFPGGVTGVVTAIDPTGDSPLHFTVEPNDATDTIPTVTAGDYLIIISGAFSEGSDQPTGAVRGTWEYENDAQIIKETIGVTGSEMVNQTWFDVTTQGAKANAYYHLGQVDIDYRTALKIDGALLFGKRTTNTGVVDATTGRVIKTTEGLFPYASRVGNTQTYTQGAFSVTEFDEMDRTLDKEGAGNYILSLLGIRLHQDIENALVTYFGNSNINYAKQAVNDALFAGNESLSASVNFKYLTKSERTFLFKRMGVLNNPSLYGEVGYEAYPAMGIFMPINKKKDPVSGNMVESIGTRYRGMGAYNRRMEVWQVGGAGEGLKVSGIDSRNTYQRCHVGAHFRGGNQFVLMNKA